VQALRGLNVLQCLLAPHKSVNSEFTALCLTEHKAFNYWTLNTPTLTHLEKESFHKNTVFKFKMEPDVSACLYVFGDGKNKGLLGLGPEVAACDTPTAVAGQFHGEVCAISCGENHNLALDSDGAVYAWGNLLGNTRSTRNEYSNIMSILTFHRNCLVFVGLKRCKLRLVGNTR